MKNMPSAAIERCESRAFTKEEILESDLRVAIMTELIEARHEKGISQKKLEELSGVSQPVIARWRQARPVPHWTRS